MLAAFLFVALLGTTGQPALDAGAGEYRAEGRRDPFVNLLKPVDIPGRIVCSPGLPGLLTAEVSLKGTVKTKGQFVALLVAPNGKTYFAQAGQRLYDGTIAAIAQDAVTVQQEIFERPDLSGTKTGTRLIRIELPQ